MNIFSAIFGSRKRVMPSCPPVETYGYANLIDEISQSDSVALLTECARLHSGYVREAALRRCVRLALPELFPVIVERLNDWVPQVRQTARTAIITLLPLVPTAQILAELPAILRLHSGGRGDHAAWLEHFEAVLVQASRCDDIVAAVQSADVRVARACTHVIWKHKLLDSASLITLILQRSDDIVLARQAVSMCSQLPHAAQVAQYQQAAQSHFGPVRVIAVRALLGMSAADRLQVATDALTDLLSPVRAVAMHYLTASGFDVRAYYRTLLLGGPRSARRTRICLSALASLRNGDDIALITAFLDNEGASIRIAAYAAWLKLAEHDKDMIACTAFGDTAPGVRKFALQAVCKHGAYIPLSLIRPCLMQRDDVAMTMRFVESQRWTWLQCIAEVALQRGLAEAYRLELDQSLRKWLGEAGSWCQNPSLEQRVYLVSGDVTSVLAQLLGGDAQAVQRLALEVDRYCRR